MEERTTLDPEQAIEFGLVHEIKSELFPSGVDLTIINESTITQNQALQQIKMPFKIPVKNFTKPSIESHSIPETINNTTIK